ncbi:beta-propeller fold lactonase family protein [Maribacter sp. 2304DJ31-5]|uniref:beta-propeller fold lactonase family protein n=1 Tax=Maribacter sp. 2304DJ31-5 TaxID=3386273 RepID=UPI0039BC7BAC
MKLKNIIVKNPKLYLSALMVFGLFFISCSDDDFVGTPIEEPEEEEEGFVGAVYAMTNGEGQIAGSNVQGPNTIIAYGRNSDGSLTPIGPNPTGGNGGDYDGGEGLDPLISAYALTKTDDNKNLLAVNAGSNTITSFNIQDDFSLEIAGESQPTGAIGPNSIAFSAREANGIRGLIYVSNITRSEFLAQGEPAQQGTVTGFWLLEDGTLSPIAGSTRNLANRPSAVQISPDGQWLVVASINSGAAALASGSEDELVVYNIGSDGLLSDTPWGTGTSTLRGNTEGRNLPSAIGFQIVGDNYVVVTEAREFQPDGTPPAFPALQDGSVSTWQIQSDGSLSAITLDVRSGEGNTGRTACWLDFTADGNTFFVSNAIEAGLASFSFDNGVVALIDQTAASGTGTGGADNGPDAFARTEGWIDMWITDDGAYLYQLFGLDGTIGIYRIDGQSLEEIGRESGNLPDTNTQGIVAI